MIIYQKNIQAAFNQSYIFKPIYSLYSIHKDYAYIHKL